MLTCRWMSLGASRKTTKETWKRLVGFQHFWFFCLGKWSNLTNNIFQMGWKPPMRELNMNEAPEFITESLKSYLPNVFQHHYQWPCSTSGVYEWTLLNVENVSKKFIEHIIIWKLILYVQLMLVLKSTQVFTWHLCRNVIIQLTPATAIHGNRFLHRSVPNVLFWHFHSTPRFLFGFQES